MEMGTREEIRLGQLAVRFRVEGKESGGSVAVFEFDVPAGAKVPVAHSHDAYEETIYGLEGVLTFTVDGQKTDVGRAMCFVSLAERFTASTMFTPVMRRCSQLLAPAFLGRSTSARSPSSPKLLPVGRLIRWRLAQ